MTHSTPPQGSHDPDDLLPDEAEIRMLYGKSPLNEPGPALDAAVLRAAAEAVSSKHDAIPNRNSADAKTQRRSPRWLIGLSSAATLVLAAGLAWRMHSMPQTERPPAVTEEVSTKAVSITAADASRASAPAAVVAPAAMPPLLPVASRQPPPQRVLEDAGSRQSMKAVAERPNLQAPRGHVSTDVSPALSAATTAALSEAEPARSPSVRPARSAADKVTAPPRIQPQVIRTGTSPTPMPALKSLPPAPPAPPSPLRSAAAVPAANQADESQSLNESPAQVAELDAIRQLFADHRDEEAQRRLEAFHRLHPEQSLSPDLQARLRKP